MCVCLCMLGDTCILCAFIHEVLQIHHFHSPCMFISPAPPTTVLTSAGKCVSLDCEMVGTGSTGDFSMLARCSVVNHHGNVLYDSYVAPMDKITDYRTKYSGITPQLLRDGESVVYPLVMPTTSSAVP